MKDKNFAVIMSGGRGERFWPLSRADKPKQFLNLWGEFSLLEASARRLLGVFEPENILVITNSDYLEPTRKMLDFLPADNVVGEPVGRDTAPALALGAALAEARGGRESRMFAFPADHVIGNESAFRELLTRITARLEKSPNGLYTIGIKPGYPATGYGYIERGDMAGEGFFRVNSFREKPSPDLAESFLERGNFYWNGGIFAWGCDFFHRELEKYTPDLAEMMDNIVRDIHSGTGLDKLAEYYSGVKKISIDYAIMEKADEVFTVEGDFDWDDAGSFPSLYNHVSPDENDNVRVGDGICRNLGVKGSILINTEKDHLLAGIGLNNMLLIHTGDATLVAPVSEAQKIKELLKLFSKEEKKYL